MSLLLSIKWNLTPLSAHNFQKLESAELPDWIFPLSYKLSLCHSIKQDIVDLSHKFHVVNGVRFSIMVGCLNPEIEKLPFWALLTLIAKW